MNTVTVIGNLTKDPEVTQTKSGELVARFTVAVPRRYKNANGDRETDFLPCVAWRGAAEFAQKYLRKGNKVCVRGSVQTRSFEAKDGTNRHVTEIIAEEVENHTPKSTTAQDGNQGSVPRASQQQIPEAAMTPVDDSDFDLPF